MGGNSFSQKKSISVGIAGLQDHQNFGDGVIGDCAEWLLQSNANDSQVAKIDMTKIIHFLPFRIFHKALHTLPLLKSIIPSVLVFICKKYFNSQVKKYDAIVFPGGSLIQYNQFFMYTVCGIIRAAEINNIPVFFNAVGIEGHSDSDPRCALYKKCLNSKAVKMISTRDDIEVLKGKYIDKKSSIALSRIADPAVFTSSVYNLAKDNDSEIIGIGVIHGNIFTNHGLDVSPSQLLDFYSDIINELEKRGLRYRLFTTGVPFDNQFVDELSKYMNSAEVKENAIIPETICELVQCISTFKGIIAGRLHANIIAYSLNVPSVGFEWSKKLSFWGANIGFPERFTPPTELNARIAFYNLEKAIEEGYDESHRASYMNTATTFIEEIYKTINEGA
jgi:polysaccharide pyruvyl transferase WcaK-like protein